MRLLRLVIGLKISRQFFNQTNGALYARFFPGFEQLTGNCEEFKLVHRVVCFRCDLYK